MIDTKSLARSGTKRLDGLVAIPPEPFGVHAAPFRQPFRMLAQQDAEPHACGPVATVAIHMRFMQPNLERGLRKSGNGGGEKQGRRGGQ
jgi:hypothetical protein